MASTEGERKANIPTHAESINDFINKFAYRKKEELKTITQFINEDIKKVEPIHKVYKAISEYMELLKGSIEKNGKILQSIKDENKKKELEDYANIIEEYILKQIYRYTFPKKELKGDMDFHGYTIKLDWITPETLDIKKSYINQIQFAIINLRKMDEAKSVYGKLRYLEGVFNNMNNNIKFSTGSNKNAGQDEVTAIFQYIMIKAHPRRVHSNINYIKCFLDPAHGGQKMFLLTQLEAAVNFIEQVMTREITLNLSKEEFNNKCREAEERIKEKLARFK